MGQWIKTRRNKIENNSKYINGLRKRLLAEELVQTKKSKKKNRGPKRQNDDGSQKQTVAN